ncbi:MAG: T9SS type A sorting domain-containing protein, partial [Candidatus Latescibacterota bacterium]
DVAEEEDAKTLPETFSLRQNAPNPFNPTTEIRYQLPEASHVELAVYDMRGRKVQVLVDRFVKAGYRSVMWEAEEVASGLYFVRMEAGEFVAVRKMVVVR